MKSSILLLFFDEVESGPIPPPGTDYVTYNGDYITYNGDYITYTPTP